MHILQTVEETLTPTKELSAGPYSFMQIRAAIGKQASLCIPREGNNGDGTRTTIKGYTKPENGEVTLHLVYPHRRMIGRPIWLRLETLSANLYQVNITLPITRGGEDFPHELSFHDYRCRSLRYLFTYYRDLQVGRRGLMEKDLDWLWLGIRWLCRTLREWDKPGITWPEEL